MVDLTFHLTTMQTSIHQWIERIEYRKRLVQEVIFPLLHNKAPFLIGFGFHWL